ncbi:MAG: hypothetical protein ACRYFX_10875 [Janthinobacterium lividum]
MPTFLRFPVGGDMLVNTEHIISVQLVQRPAEQKDVDRAGHLFQLGQMMYQVRLRLPNCNSVDLEYPVEANRDTVYEEIITVLNPTVIDPFTPAPPAPSEKPPRKPYTRKPKP